MKPECLENAPNDELQKMSPTKARKFKPQPRLEPALKHWWQARKVHVLTITPHVAPTRFVEVVVVVAAVVAMLRGIKRRMTMMTMTTMMIIMTMHDNNGEDKNVSNDKNDDDDDNEWLRKAQFYIVSTLCSLRKELAQTRTFTRRQSNMRSTCNSASTWCKGTPQELTMVEMKLHLLLV